MNSAGEVVDTFTGGTLSIDRLRIDQRTGELLASGSITDGTLENTSGTVNETFQNVTADSLNPNADCTILTLDLGPLSLELLGLQVDLAEVLLDITGETGSGNLLGNLLCAIADIGAGGGLSDLANNIVSALNNLLNQLL